MDFTVVGGQLAHLTKLRCFIRQQTKNDKQTKHYQKIVRNLPLSKVTICNKQESHSACNWTPNVAVVVDTMYQQMHESCNISVCKVHVSQNWVAEGTHCSALPLLLLLLLPHLL